MRVPPRFRAVLANGLLALLALAPLAWLYRDWLDPWSMPERGDAGLPGLFGDLTPQFAVWHRVIQQALWEEGSFPLWNRFVFAGEPLFAKPQVAVLGPGTLLGGLFPFPLSLKLDILLHLLLGAAGVVVLCRRLGAPALVASGAAALVLLEKVLSFHLSVGHLNVVYGMAWTPWLWAALLRALAPGEPRPLRWATAAGALVAMQLWDGADLTLVQGYPAVALLFLGILLASPQKSTLLRSVQVAGTVLGVALVLGAVRLLPLLEYLALGNRRDGVPWPQVTGVADAVGTPVITPAAMVGALLALLAWRRQRGAVLGLLLVAGFGALAATQLGFYRALYDHLPGFRDQRIPARAWWLVGLAVPLLLSLAAAGIQGLLPRWPRAVHAASALAILVLVGLQLRDMPPRPRMVDSRQEVQSNAFLRTVAKRVGDGRLNLFENEGRHWGAEHVTVPLGIEVVVGYEPAWIPEYLSPQFYLPDQLAFLDMAQKRPARTWGLVAASLVGSTVPRELPGFRLLEVTPPCPRGICQPAKSAGPYLYENTEALPRAFTANRSVLLAGTGKEAEQLFQEVMLDDAWDPRKVVLLRAGLRGEPIQDAQLRSASMVVLHRSARLPALFQGDVPPVVTVDGPRLTDALRARLREVANGAPPIHAQPWTRTGNTLRICPTDGGMLVLSSKYAMVPGWKARTDQGQELPVLLANGAATAVPRDGQPGCVQLHYRPASLTWGAGITGGGLLLLLLGLARRRRPASPASHPSAA